MVTHLKPISISKTMRVSSDRERGYPLLRQQATSTVSCALWSDGGGIFFI